MARVRMVTRTVKGTCATVMCLDTESAEAMNIIYEIGGTFTDNAKLLKELKKAYETDTIKLVHIVHAEEIEQLYGMPESVFLQYAEKLPPRNSANEGDDE